MNGVNAMRLFAFISLLFCAQVQATADGPDFYRAQVLPTGESLPLFAEARSGARVLLRVPSGASCLRNQGCSGGLSLEEFSALDEVQKTVRLKANPRWCKVEYQGVSGWIAGRFLSEGECSPISRSARVERVLLDSGKAQIKSRIKGDDYVDYKITGGAGQVLSVDLKASNRQNYFNLLPPGSETALFVGSSSGNNFSRSLPIDGEYTLRVYLMRAAARRNEVSNYQLNINLVGKALAPLAASVDALIPGTPFHASAQLPCQLRNAESSGQCEAFVIRRSFDGTATLELRWRAYGQTVRRHVLFLKGEAVSSNSPDELRAVRQGDLFNLIIGEDEFFVIPDALIRGG